MSQARCSGRTLTPSSATVTLGPVTQQWPAPEDPHSAFRRPQGVGSQASPWGAQQPRQWAVPFDPYATDANLRDPYSTAQRTAWSAPQTQQQWSPFGSPHGNAPFTPQPRRRRHPLLRLLRTLIFLGLLSFIGLALLGWWASTHIELPAPSEVPVTTPAPHPTSKPTDATTGNPSPTASRSAGDWANDSYAVPAADRNPPALPEPQTYEEATDLLKANALYPTSVPIPVRCTIGELDLQKASKAQVTAHLNEMMGCLMRVWAPPLETSGYEAVRPSVTVYSGSISTKCGRLRSMNASYCGADQQVYYAEDLPDVVPSSLRGSRFITESVIAHEFGHAVQARSGILLSEQAWEDKTSDKAGQLLYSRRLEQQADCFAGQFLGSVAKSNEMTPTEMTNVSKLFYSIGDDVLTDRAGYLGNHGQGANRQAWIQVGLDSPALQSCNTFTAPASRVR